jgi:hypothetical protein
MEAFNAVLHCAPEIDGDLGVGAIVPGNRADKARLNTAGELQSCLYFSTFSTRQSLEFIVSNSLVSQ